MNTERRHVLSALGLTLAAVMIPHAAQAGWNDAEGLRSGMVFTSSNDSAGNELLV